jgi:dienelactone hydrolase
MDARDSKEHQHGAMTHRSKNIKRKSRRLWFVILAVIVLGICAASAYAVRWYERFYHHVTAQELSHEVKHSSFVAPIRDGPPLTLQLYQQEHAANQPLVLFTSGDGGWSPFCADIAAHIAATGLTVVGIDIKEYLVNFASSQKPVSVDELAHDYNSIAGLSTSQPGVNTKSRLTLAGWSVGAGYSVLIASQPQFQDQVDRVVAISLPIYNELAWKPTDALIYITHGTPREKVFDARLYLEKPHLAPIVFLNATDDDTSPLKEAQSLYKSAAGSKQLYIVKASGHHFEGGEKEFYSDLDRGISTAIQ